MLFVNADQYQDASVDN